MANEDVKKSYPYIPENVWWLLRKKFIQTLPKSVTTDYLQTVSGRSTPASAKILLGPLRALGLIDDEGKPTARAEDWRLDDQYGAACAEMVSDAYPSELADAFPSADVELNALANWFVRNAKVGAGTANNMARMYLLLKRGDPNPPAGNGRSAKPATGGALKATKATAAKPSSATEPDTVRIPPATKTGGHGVTVNLNIQLTLPDTSDPAVYDAFFAAMKKHLLDD